MLLIQSSRRLLRLCLRDEICVYPCIHSAGLGGPGARRWHAIRVFRARGPAHERELRPRPRPHARDTRMPGSGQQGVRASSYPTGAPRTRRRLRWPATYSLEGWAPVRRPPTSGGVATLYCTCAGAAARGGVTGKLPPVAVPGQRAAAKICAGPNRAAAYGNGLRPAGVAQSVLTRWCSCRARRRPMHRPVPDMQVMISKTGGRQEREQPP